MKKFITAIPLQVQTPLQKYKYTAVDNAKLKIEDKTSFPIIPTIHGYVKSGETIQVIALVTDLPAGHKNYEELCDEIKELCTRTGIQCQNEVQKIIVSEDQRVATHIATIQKLMDYIDNKDELYLCMTYGTKPLSQAMLMAMQHAKTRKNASIECIVYGEIKRPTGDESEWKGNIYDMTALAYLDDM